MIVGGLVLVGLVGYAMGTMSQGSEKDSKDKKDDVKVAENLKVVELPKPVEKYV